jgi:hypothetical protein
LTKPTPQQIEAARQALDAKLIEIAVAKGAVRSANDAIVRDLLPDNDLRASGDIQYFEQQVSAGAWASPTYSGTLDDDQVMGIYGVKALNAVPKTAAIRFWDGTGRTAVIDIWQVEAAWGEEESPMAIAIKPIIYEPDRGFNIDQYAKSAGADQIAFLGRVVEPKGKTVRGDEH